MQVKKFEAPTIQEALEHVKRELGPEAIILQTKKNRRGFGLLSKGSVEITAAISDRSLQKKQNMEVRVPEPTKTAIQGLSAQRQADLLDKYAQKTQDRVELSKKPNLANQAGRDKRITATRYIDIQDSPTEALPPPVVKTKNVEPRPTRYASPPTSPVSTMPIEDEVKHLKKMIEELKGAQQQSAEWTDTSKKWLQAESALLEAPALQDAFEMLVLNGMERRYAFPLLKRLAFDLGNDRSISTEQVQDLLAGEIMDSIEVFSPFSQIVPRTESRRDRNPIYIALIGPTGVGKTTTVAKIASDARIRRNLKVGLINSDDYKPTSFDQLGTYAKILNLPFRSAMSDEDLKAALSDFQNLDVVMIDTAGRSQKDPESIHELEEFLARVPELRTFLVVSTTTRDTELNESVARFSVLKPQGLIFSKLDEATLYGSIYNLSQRSKLPLSYFTTGQRVPDDIEEASAERLAALLMNL